MDRSPVTLDELELLKRTVGLTTDDERYLRQAGDVLAGRAAEMVEAWRSAIAEHPHLARYSAHPDGRPNPEYAAASFPRFVAWITDVCAARYDQDWLDHQHEIGLRHTRARKNATDSADSLDHIPMRYLLAFTAVVLTTSRDFLAGRGHPREDVDRMHEAWTKAVLLHLTLWTRPYVSAENW